MCNSCIQVPLCQWDGCWFDFGPSAGRAELLGNGTVATYKLKPASSTDWSGGVISPAWLVCHAGGLDLGPLQGLKTALTMRFLHGSGRQHAASLWAHSPKKAWPSLAPSGYATPVVTSWRSGHGESPASPRPGHDFFKGKNKDHVLGIGPLTPSDSS